VGLVLELIGGIDASLDRDVARRPRGEGPCLRDRHDRGDGEDLPDPERIGRTSAGSTRPRASASRPEHDREEGSHGGDYSRWTLTSRSHGPRHGRARRNLHDTWALMRSPPLVSFGPSGLLATLRARRRQVNGSYPRISASRSELSTTRPHRGVRSVVEPLGDPAISEVAAQPLGAPSPDPACELAVEAGQDEPTADQLSGRSRHPNARPARRPCRRARGRTFRSPPGRGRDGASVSRTAR
jgi:hypothetical protein